MLYASDRETAIIYRMPKDVRLEDVTLPEGSVSIGYFWSHKPYNAYHWIDDRQRSLALYFNICDQVKLSRDTIAWRDLSVDVLITPDARCRVLDEDELPADLDPELRDYIDAARAPLCEDSVHLLAAFAARSRKLLREN